MPIQPWRWAVISRETWMEAGLIGSCCAAYRQCQIRWRSAGECCSMLGEGQRVGKTTKPGRDYKKLEWSSSFCEPCWSHPKVFKTTCGNFPGLKSLLVATLLQNHITWCSSLQGWISADITSARQNYFFHFSLEHLPINSNCYYIFICSTNETKSLYKEPHKA